MVGPHDEVEKGHFPEQTFPFLLSQTAGEPQDQVGVLLLEGFQVAEQGENFLFRLFPNGAGVDEDQIRIFLFMRPGVAGMKKKEFHALRIGHVHLAAKGIEINLFHGNKIK